MSTTCRYCCAGEEPRDELDGEDVELIGAALESQARFNDSLVEIYREKLFDDSQPIAVTRGREDARATAARCRALAARLRGER